MASWLLSSFEPTFCFRGKNRKEKEQAAFFVWNCGHFLKMNDFNLRCSFCSWLRGWGRRRQIRRPLRQRRQAGNWSRCWDQDVRVRDVRLHVVVGSVGSVAWTARSRGRLEVEVRMWDLEKLWIIDKILSVCCTGLPLARTGWVWSTFSRHCPLSSYQCHWLTSAASMIFPLKFFLRMLGFKPRAARWEASMLPLCSPQYWDKFYFRICVKCLKKNSLGPLQLWWHWQFGIAPSNPCQEQTALRPPTAPRLLLLAQIRPTVV